MHEPESSARHGCKPVASAVNSRHLDDNCETIQRPVTTNGMCSRGCTVIRVGDDDFRSRMFEGSVLPRKPSSAGQIDSVSGKLQQARDDRFADVGKDGFSIAVSGNSSLAASDFVGLSACFDPRPSMAFPS